LGHFIGGSFYYLKKITSAYISSHIYCKIAVIAIETVSVLRILLPREIG